MASIIRFAKQNWATISAVVLALVGVLAPDAAPASSRILAILASILGAVGMGSMAARSAVRSEARRLGLVPSKD